MQSPRSFTREDVVEIHCHGGTMIMQQILQLVLDQGARLADPGEFTRRAFLNGRIDLLQAESIIDLIRAKTETSVQLAQLQRDGSVSARLNDLQQSLRQLLALTEAYVDFPDEDLGAVDSTRLHHLLDSALATLSVLVKGCQEGKIIRDGVSVLIAGKPNVGKSSLLNTLLREKRAIVTSIPGTTRDLIEEVVNLRGLPVNLLDTAGICRSDDPVEQEGIRRAMERIPTADLVLFLLDASRPFDDDDGVVAEALADSRVLIVLNKSDLPPLLQLPGHLESLDRVSISTSSGAGIEELKDAVASLFFQGKAADSRDLVVLSRARHRDALLRVETCLSNFSVSIQADSSPELLALDLREALDALGQITGETTPDDILDLIFGQFCIGK
jgi:tRNA modification GTPase